MTSREAEPELTALLQEFGPPRKSDHPEQPSWRLQRDGIWTVQAPAGSPLKTGDTIPRVGALRSPGVHAGFSADVQTALATDPGLVAAIAHRILDQHFPESLHHDILDAVGLNLETTTSTRRKRDPDFRQRVLEVYGYRCAVCGFDVRLGAVPIALAEASRVEARFVEVPRLQPSIDRPSSRASCGLQVGWPGWSPPNWALHHHAGRAHNPGIVVIGFPWPSRLCLLRRSWVSADAAPGRVGRHWYRCCWGTMPGPSRMH